MDFALAGLIGALVGVGELVSRYRDEPLDALKNIPAILYIALNAAAAVVAVQLMKLFDWTLGAEGETAIQWTRILAAGFGSMALFRTSLFSIRVGDQDIGIGPVSFLQVVLTAADRAVDRYRAQARAKVVQDVMRGIDFQMAHEALPAYAFALMQNLPKDEQELFARQVITVVNSKMSNEVKSMLLGLALMNLVGEDVLTAAVESLSDELSTVEQ